MVLAHVVDPAAAQGDNDAQETLTGAPTAVTPDQIAEAERLAREWKPAAKR